MKPVTWAYSSLTLFEQCPHKYYRLRVARDIKEPESEAMKFGRQVHMAAEYAIRDGTPVPRAYAFLDPYVERMKATQGTKLTEYKMGLTRDLKPCEFFAKDVWVRGVADLVILRGHKALSWDWKTGKADYPDTDQLQLMAIMLFRHFPEVKQIGGGLLFVLHKRTVVFNMERETAKPALAAWVARAIKLERAYEGDAWPRKQNFTCKNWCPVMDCPFNGRA